MAYVNHVWIKVSDLVEITELVNHVTIADSTVLKIEAKLPSGRSVKLRRNTAKQEFTLSEISG